MPLSDKEKGMLDKLEGLLSGLLESGKGAVSDKEMGLLSVVPPEKQTGYETLNVPKQAEMEAKKRSTLNSLGVDAINQTSQGAISEREIQHFMSTQSHPVKIRLNEIRGAVSDVEFQMFMRQYMAGQIPEGALFDSLPNTQQGANLGFTAPEQYAQGSQFYNSDLGVFLPSEWQTGFTGRTVDGDYYSKKKQFDSYPHSSNRNYYNEKMMLPRYIPINLG